MAGGAGHGVACAQALRPQPVQGLRLGQGAPALIFTCRVDGRGRCLHVRVRDEAEMRKAVENGRRLVALLAEEGVRLVESLRAEADAD